MAQQSCAARCSVVWEAIGYFRRQEREYKRVLAEWTSYFVTSAGVLVGFLTLLDWALSDSQKKMVKGWAETAWLWLSDQQARTYLEVILSDRTQRVMMMPFGLILAAESLGLLHFLRQEEGMLTAVNVLRRMPPETAAIVHDWLFPITWTCFGGIIYIMVHPMINTRWLQGRSYWVVGERLAAISLVGVCCMVLLHHILADPGLSVEAGLPWMFVSPALVYLFLLCVWVFWLVTTSFLMLLMRAAQFLMFKIATYEKGPFLALSACLMAIGLVIKPFAGQ